MCIRDRDHQDSKESLVFTLVFSCEKVYEINPELIEALDQACLLYTSDAADERSSVDLGGRRIIKKKKNTH